jgi:hypothetical protein
LIVPTLFDQEQPHQREREHKTDEKERSAGDGFTNSQAHRPYELWTVIFNPSDRRCNPMRREEPNNASNGKAYDRC